MHQHHAPDGRRCRRSDQDSVAALGDSEMKKKFADLGA